LDKVMAATIVEVVVHGAEVLKLNMGYTDACCRWLKAQVHAGVPDQERISGSLAELEAYRAKLAEEYTVKLTGSDTWMKAE